MRIALVSIAAFLCAAILAVGLLTHSAFTRTDQRISHLQQQLTATRAELSTVEAGQSGSHRDLVTCGDLQQIETLIDGIVASQGDIGPVEFSSPNGGVVAALPLPSHCINQ
jgi:hypothetical protein